MYTHALNSNTMPIGHFKISSEFTTFSLHAVELISWHRVQTMHMVILVIIKLIKDACTRGAFQLYIYIHLYLPCLSVGHVD
jgi:hypothetical protein